METDRNSVHPLVGRIIFANILSMPIPRYEAHLRRVLDGDLPRYRDWVHTAFLPNATTGDDLLPREAIASLSRSPCGAVAVAYRQDCFRITHTPREEAEALARRDPQFARLRHRLRSIRMRNEMTHALILRLADLQRAYLESGDPTRLVPLGQSAFSRLGVHDALDPSRLSRLSRAVSIRTPFGEIVPLRRLFASRRDVLRARLERILASEREGLATGRISRPAGDDLLARSLHEATGWNITVKTAGEIRRAAGAGPARLRRPTPYPPREFDLGVARPLDHGPVRGVPRTSGVYELLLERTTIPYPKRISSVFYIGKSGLLPRRLASHIAATRRGVWRTRGVPDDRILFRTARVFEDLRAAEHALLAAFTESHGSLPLGNRNRG